MSTADDCEFVRKIVEKSEKYICAELVKLQREVRSWSESLKGCHTNMKAQDAKIKKLETALQVQDHKISTLQTEKQGLLEQVEALKAQIENFNAHSACKLTIQKAFASALQSVLPDDNLPSMDTSVLETSVVQQLPPEPMSYMEVTSTPQQQEAAPVQLYQARHSNLGKRKFPSSTSE